MYWKTRGGIVFVEKGQNPPGGGARPATNNEIVGAGFNPNAKTRAEIRQGVPQRPNTGGGPQGARDRANQQKLGELRGGRPNRPPSTGGGTPPPPSGGKPPAEGQPPAGGFREGLISNKHRPGDPFFSRLTSDIADDENFVQNVIARINETDDVVLLKQAFDDLLVLNPLQNEGAFAELGAAFKARTQELADLDPYEQGVDEFKIAETGLKEKKEIEDLAEKQQGIVEEFTEDFGQRTGEFLTSFDERAAARRKATADDLEQLASQFFERQTPGILETLNSLGFGTSESTVTNALGDQLEELELARQGALTDFDLGLFGERNRLQENFFNTGQALLGSALDIGLGGAQAGLNSYLDAGQAGLTRSFQLADRNAFMSAEGAARRASQRNATLNAILGGAANITSSLFAPKGFAANALAGFFNRDKGNTPDPNS